MCSKQSESEVVSPSTRMVRSVISEATGCFNCYISRRNFLFIFIDSFLSIIIICVISSISIIISESYFRDRLTFSNIDSRTSRRIYRLALLLRAPETLSSLSKSRISIFNAHLTLLVHKMTSHNSIGKYRHLVN